MPICRRAFGYNSGFNVWVWQTEKAGLGAGHAGEPVRALAAGMFHRGEYTVGQVKDYLESKGINVRR